jgi:hypothetical protein
VKEIEHDIRITKEDMVSQTLMDLFVALNDNLKNTLRALLIGNIVTSALSNKPPTDLQIALGNLVRDSKSLTTCSYDKILHFKKSAA